MHEIVRNREFIPCIVPSAVHGLYEMNGQFQLIYLCTDANMCSNHIILSMVLVEFPCCLEAKKGKKATHLTNLTSVSLSHADTN